MGALTHTFPAALELMAIFIAATGLLVPEYRSAQLSELKWAYWFLVWGTTVCSMVAALVAGISLLELSGGPAYPRTALILLAGVIIAVVIGAPVFMFFAVDYL
jgi:hypothetical protein